MKKKIFFSVSIMALIALAFFLFPRPAKHGILRLYAAAGLRPAVEKLVAAFDSTTGIHVEPDYGGSGIVLAKAHDDKQADLFFPGDGFYVDRLQELNGSVVQQVGVGYFVPVIIVAKGNPKNIHGLADLARPDLHIGLGDAKACQVGRITSDMLAKAGVQPPAPLTQLALTVNELGVWVKMRTVDVAVVWDATAASIAADVDTIGIEPKQTIISQLILARLKQSRFPEDAEHFLKFVEGPQGQAILRQAGYRTNRP